MSYTVYRNTKVLDIKTENVSRQWRPQEIVDISKRRSDYSVLVASFADTPCDVGISDFTTYLQKGQTVSIAVNDKWQVIAVVNHTTGKSASLKYKGMNFSEILSALFFISIPTILIFSVGYKAMQTEKYHDYSWGIGGFGIIIIFLILRGINKEFSESKAALRELGN